MRTTLQKIISGTFFNSIMLKLCLMCATTSVASAQTLISGNISGTWWPSGNPFVVTDNATVPSGQTLAIQPGVEVWIGENLSITAYGLIQALGTPTNRITFQAPITAQYWSNIYCIHTDGTNRFKYCDFRNAETALRMGVYGNDATMNIEIMNCTFSNCLEQGIYGEAQGLTYAEPPLGSAHINPVVKNCVFNKTGNGCVLKIWGAPSDHGWYPRWGYAQPTIIGNIFKDLSGTALLMDIGIYAANGSPIFINNTIINCQVGIDSQEPWDARVENNIFVGATNAVRTSGSLSRNVRYNCFYGNATNFVGYPTTYGKWILANRNGTLSDLSYNIGQDPLFFTAEDLHLNTNSPCIDAGTTDWAFSDMCFPPSQGTAFPDLGAYGGPDAANWLDVVPKLPVQASTLVSSNVVQLGWGAIPRSKYQVQYLTSLASEGTNTWLNFTNGSVLAMDKPVYLVVATNSTLPQMYFRIQSLGRTPGN